MRTNGGRDKDTHLSSIQRARKPCLKTECGQMSGVQLELQRFLRHSLHFKELTTL